MPIFPGVAGDVYYQRWEAPRARAVVVLLHGFGEHSGLYHRLGAALAARGVSLWALDEIGHGLSAGDRGIFDSLDDLAENAARLRAIVDREEPGLPVVLAGHSLGAVTTALIAGRAPEAYAGYVLSGSVLSPLGWVAELAAGGDLDLDPSGLSAEPAYLDALDHDPLAFTSAAAAANLARAFPPAWDELPRTLPDVTRPVLLVHGEQDPVAPLAVAREWAATLPAGRLVAVPGGLHDILNDREHEVVALILAAFVREVALTA